MKRLEKILSMIDSRIGVADVGTDHGFLPVSLALQGYCGNLFATDIHAAPLEAAKRAAEEAGVKDRIRFCLTDGLDGIDPRMLDTIVIAGLGGDVICSILDRAEWTMDPAYRMILQPMTKAEVLRFWLCNNGYEIPAEHLVQENGRIFRILSVRFSGDNTPMTDAELYLGKTSLAKQEACYGQLLEQEIERMRKKTEGLLVSGSSREADFFCSILQEMLQIRKNRAAMKGEH